MSLCESCQRVGSCSFESQMMVSTIAKESVQNDATKTPEEKMKFRVLSVKLDLARLRLAMTNGCTKISSS